MTITSLKLLAHFLNLHPQEGRIADYGGTDNIGSNIIEQMLNLTNVRVIQVKPSKGDPVSPIGVNINVTGEPKLKTCEYHALDFDNGVDLLKPIRGKKFNGGVCMDLLEHTSNPFIIAKNISESLKKGAFLFVTVPMIWEEHKYPIDCWRFMPQGLELLFPKMECITIEVIRDQATEEEVPRTRLVGIFKKK